MKRRVAVTGIGVVSAAGIGREALWKSLETATSGVGPLTAFDVPDDFPVKIAGQVTDFKPQGYVAKRKSLKVMARDIQLAVAGAKLALDDAGLASGESIAPERLGTSIGAGYIQADLNELVPSVRASLDDPDDPESFDMRKFGREGMPNLFPLWLLKYLPNMLACHVSIFHDARGPNNTITVGHASATQAVGEAARIIERGEADAFIAGGGESLVHPVTLVRHELRNRLSHETADPGRAVRPFDVHRSGYAVGEGAAMLVLEEMGFAEARGATIYAEVAGFGAACDAADARAVQPDGRGVARAVAAALADAGIGPAEADAVIAAGYALAEEDRSESRAYRRVFGGADGVPITTVQPLVGNTGAAAGAIDMAAAVLAVSKQTLFPTANLEEIDPECGLAFVTGEARKTRLANVVQSIFGSAGQCAAAVVRSVE